MPDDTAPPSQTASTETPGPATEALLHRRGKWRRRVIRWTLLLIGPIAAILIGGYIYYSGGRYASTDNAYIKADKVTLGAEVSGVIAGVPVAENEDVAAGDVLFRLDDSQYRVKLAKAEADLAEVVSSIASTKANYREMQAELGSARGDANYAKTEWQRQAGLKGTSAASKMKLDAARHDLETARHKVAVISEQLKAIRATLAGGVDVPVERNPRYQAAKADRDLAELNLQHTLVKAPFSGVVRNVPKVGRYVSAGEGAISLVADKRFWIEANFKETELTYIRPGQPVSISVDTYPDQTWTGKVDSISQATGAEFAILPAQNATGNWVKVVQRIPVRIAVKTEGDGDGPDLRSGMSSSVEIDTGYSRPMPKVVRVGLSWLDDAQTALASEAANK
jgi:membrane fusion protein (multidrug efflux system)